MTASSSSAVVTERRRGFSRRYDAAGGNPVAILVSLLLKSLENWSERGDLNSRPPVPQTGALTELRYAPKPWCQVDLHIHAQADETSHQPVRGVYSLAKARTR